MTVLQMKITDVAPQKRNKNRVSVYVDGEYSFSLDSADALRLGVKIDAEISEKDIEIYNLESNLSKAKEKAFDIVSRKAVTEKELVQKLLDKGYDKIICDIVLETMLEYNYINDYDFCISFFDYAVAKGWGMMKIRNELKRKGVSDDVLAEALDEFEDSPEQRIYEILERRYDADELKDFKEKQRAVRFFASRGFGFDSINGAISRFISENNEDW